MFTTRLKDFDLSLHPRPACQQGGKGLLGNRGGVLRPAARRAHPGAHISGVERFGLPTNGQHSFEDVQPVLEADPGFCCKVSFSSLRASVSPWNPYTHFWAPPSKTELCNRTPFFIPRRGRPAAPLRALASKQKARLWGRAFRCCPTDDWVLYHVPVTR